MANETGNEITIQCSMTVANVRERRFLSFNLARFKEMSRLIEAGESSPSVQDARYASFGDIVRGISAFCAGEVYGKDVSDLNQLEDLEDETIVQIAEAVLGQLEEEAAKKSKESSPLSLRVVTG